MKINRHTPYNTKTKPEYDKINLSKLYVVTTKDETFIACPWDTSGPGGQEYVSFVYPARIVSNDSSLKSGIISCYISGNIMYDKIIDMHLADDDEIKQYKEIAYKSQHFKSRIRSFLKNELHL